MKWLTDKFGESLHNFFSEAGNSTLNFKRFQPHLTPNLN